MSALNRTVSVAPMMDWTDRHQRYFMRKITRHTLLYTEMVNAQAILRGNRQKLLGYHPSEHPIAVQLGGSQPDILSKAALIAEDYGYDEINLNVGCPSDRVQQGRFGACLMAEPQRVAECVQAMQSKVSVPVTIKCRIGIDDLDTYEFLHQFIALLSQAGCQVFIIHARKALLSGLSPKQNREIPPLNYQRVYQIKQDFPKLCIVINGGIQSLEDIQSHLHSVDGVMLGREAYRHPYLLSEMDHLFYNDQDIPLTRYQVVEAMLEYISHHLKQGGRLQQVARHMLGLFLGQPGGRKWRQLLSEQAHKKEAHIDVIQQALQKVIEQEKIIHAAKNQ